MDSILRVSNLSKIFGGLSALSNVSLEVVTGMIVGIIGPNGAGKTTLFNCLTGLYYPTAGQVFFQERSVVPEISTRKPQHVRRCTNGFLIFSLAWAPLFWAFFISRTPFKVELSLLVVFILSIRMVVARGLKQLQIWAWSVMFVFLLGDLYLAIWWLAHASSLGQVPAIGVKLAYFAFPWSILDIPFSVYLMWQLMLREVRLLYGFRLGPDEINRLGMARTFQNIRLFLSLSVLDNVKIGAHGKMQQKVWSALFRTRSQRSEEKDIEQEALEHLRFVGLEHRAFDLSGVLAYGEQRRLELARALASHPRLLLLDEPAAGMNPLESAQLMQLIRKIRDRGITVLIIEHDMKVMMNLADHIYAFDHGELIAQGTPNEIRANPRVIEAYLGRGMADAQA
ncbi:MAG: ABC transporter ATP-binding protein [Syntrophobacterales bacterium]|jgi:ABC-type branched-subunit amino acid transport system ATPase component